MVFLRFCTVVAALTLSSSWVAPVSPDTNGLLEMMNALQIRVEELEKSDVQLTKKVDEAVGAWEKGKQVNADSLFLATISTETVPILPEERIIWDSAPINPGGHFSTTSGSYTAPFNGFYTFSVNKEGDTNHGSFYLLVDEERYAYKETWVSTDCCPAGSATINLELTAGQIVRVENTGSSLLYGTQPGGFMKSWFTGHLLYAL